MKKAIAILAAVAAFTAQAGEKLVVGATPVPHAEILEFVKPALAKEGVDLDIKVFSDFIQPNLQLAEKNLDANYYQYRPFLDDFNKTRHTDLVPVVGVHIEPFGAYSTKIKNLADLPDGADRVRHQLLERVLLGVVPAGLREVLALGQGPAVLHGIAQRTGLRVLRNRALQFQMNGPHGGPLAGLHGDLDGSRLGSLRLQQPHLDLW